MNAQQKPSVTNEFGEEVFHDGRASFDIRPFLPYLQRVIDVWDVDDETSDAIIDSVLNPASHVREVDHWITLADLLIRWNFEEATIEALEHVPSSHERYDYVLETLLLAYERLGSSADVERVRAEIASRGAVEEDEEEEAGTYAMDRFAQELGDVVFYAIQGAGVSGDALWGLKLVGKDAGAIIPEEVWLSWSSDGSFENKIQLAPFDTRLPKHVDDVRNARRTEEPSLSLIDELKITDDTLEWDDRFGLLRQLLYYELKRTLQSIADRLVDDGVSLGEGCRLAVGDPDDNFVSLKPGEPLKLGALQKRLKSLQRSRADLEAIAELCFDDSERQGWFVDVAQQK